ncbi:MAG: histidine--tRNA ligase, partial [Verrucomicrobia bacterium]
QFKAAAESGAKLALIFGSDEVAKGSVKIRDMAVRSEEEIARSELESTVREFFSK